MRLILRFSMLLVVGGLAWSQALTDAAGVLAGSSVGVGAGKKVGQGISSALDSANGVTAKAAKTQKIARAEKPAADPTAKPPAQRAGDGGGSSGSGSSGASSGSTVLKTGPGGVVKDHSLVPPPPVKKTVAVVPPPPPLVEPPAPVLLTPVLVLPPPPQATPADLKTLATGSSREEVLKLGPPSSRVTMIGDDGRLVEVFRYQTRESTFGVVRLSDGSVSSVEIR